MHIHAPTYALLHRCVFSKYYFNSCLIFFWLCFIFIQWACGRCAAVWLRQRGSVAPTGCEFVRSIRAVPCWWTLSTAQVSECVRVCWCVFPFCLYTCARVCACARVFCVWQRGSVASAWSSEFLRSIRAVPCRWTFNGTGKWVCARLRCVFPFIVCTCVCMRVWQRGSVASAWSEFVRSIRAVTCWWTLSTAQVS